MLGLNKGLYSQYKFVVRQVKIDSEALLLDREKYFVELRIKEKKLYTVNKFLNQNKIERTYRKLQFLSFRLFYVFIYITICVLLH
jgi:hypothetical protein